MKVLALTFCIILSSFPAFGQNNKTKIRIYNAKIKCFDKNYFINGAIYDFNDSTIIITSVNSKQDLKNHNLIFQKIPVTSIEYLKIRRKGKVGSNALIGAIICGTSGAIIGYSIGDDDPSNCGSWGNPCFSASDYAAMYGIPLFIVGGIAGAVAGVRHTHISIDGESENIQLNRKLLEKCSLLK